MVDNVFGTRSGNTAIFPQSDGNQAFIDWEALFSKDGQIPALAKQARLPQSDNAKSTANSGLQDLTTADAKPCATCDTNQAYSLAFQVMDGSPDKCRPCAGMYYTVYFKLGSYPPDKGQTDENGLTARYFCSNPAEEIYLYIGHREKEDGYPTSRDTDEHKYDEAPLWNAKVALVAEKKVIEAKTKRLWKPWGASDEYKKILAGAEEAHPKQYPSPEGGLDTIGIGHKITPSEVKSDRFNQGYWKQPLSDEKMKELQDEDIAKNGGNDIGYKVFVPLYDHEVDAVLDLGFNGGKGALSSDASSLYDENGNKNPPKTNVQNLAKILNRGSYSLVKKYMKNHYNTSNKVWSAGVQNRRDMDARMFNEEKDGYKMIYTHTSKRKSK